MAITYARPTTDDLLALSQLHLGTMTGRLTFYGPSFVRRFYALALLDPGTISWTAEEGGAWRGL